MTPSPVTSPKPTRLATFNVNGIRAREGNLLAWLESAQPDYALLQEIKCEAANFPPSLAKAGWHAAIAGQKGFNGVAILARAPLTITRNRLPGLPEDDAQARYIEVETPLGLIGNLYLPNGNSGGEAGYAYKLAWMDALCAHAERLLDEGTPFLLAGDYNVCPEPVDCARGALPDDDALLRPATRDRFWRLIFAGMTDALRAIKPSGPAYTFWDYQGGAFDRDRGVRIDHALLSPAMAERLVDVRIDRAERNKAQPSDHTPVVVEFA